MTDRLRRAAASLGIATVLVLLAGPAAARLSRDEPLAEGMTRLRDLAPGESHSYEVHLEREQFLEAVVTPHGIDVAVALANPGSGDARGMDLSDDPLTPEPILLVATRSGSHRLTVRAAQAGVPPGRYEIAIRAIRASTAVDRVRVAAMQDLEAGARARRAVTPDAATAAQARASLDAALAAFREAGDAAFEARSMWELADLNWRVGRPEALEHSRRAVAMYRALPDRNGLAKAVNVLGILLDRAGDRAGAHEAYTEALTISGETGNRALAAHAEMNIGVVFGRTGDSERAVEHFVRALALFRLMRLRTHEIRTLNNLGIATKNLGEYRLSLDYYTQALDAARSLGTRGDEANLLNNIGNLQRVLGEDAQALQSHEQALAIARQLGHAEHEARALNTIGSTLYQLGRYDEALSRHLESLAIRRRIAEPAGEAAALDGAGRAAYALGRREESREWLLEALRIRRDISDRLGEANTLRHLASLDRDSGRLREALEHGDAAVRVTDTLRGGLFSPDLRASFVAAEQEQYELRTDVLMRLHEQQPDAGFAGRALEAAEHGRARVLIESLLEARADIRRGIDPALLGAERALHAQLEEASTRVSRLASRPTSPDALTAAREALERLNGEYRQLQTRIRKESPGYAALVQPQPLTVADIQQDLLDRDVILLEYALGAERSWLWAVTHNRFASFELPPRGDIESAARRMHDLLAGRQPRSGESARTRALRVAQADRELRRASADVGRLLLGPAAAHLGSAWRGKRLLVVAAEVLEYLPFAALADPATGAPLIADHEVVNLPSASVLAALREQTSGRRPPAGTVAVLADPVFEADDPRIARIRRTAAAGEAGARNASVAAPRHERRGLEPPGGGRLTRLARLPFSRQEARAIAALVPPAKRLEATDFDASRETAMSGALGEYRLVHFATHGFLDSEHPQLSGLVLSLVNRTGDTQDGFLRLTDIYNLQLPADVVVLSACQTALGKAIRGEGLVGLTRGFMYAGAQRVVASLWQVDDLATAELMRLFYRGMLEEGLRPAAALRAAQRELARQPRWASPFFWAAFVLQGEYR